MTSQSVDNFVAHTALQYLAKHMYIVYAATQLLLDFFTDVLYKNWSDAEEKRETIKTFTQQAHFLQQAVGVKLPKERWAIVERTDVITLLQMQTRIANKAKAITGLVMGRKMELPPMVAIDFFPLLNQSLAAVQQTYLLINHLNDLNSSPARKEVKEQLALMIAQLDVLENATDQMQIQARNALLALEAAWPPIEVLALYKLLEWTGDLADRAHELGGRLISILTH